MTDRHKATVKISMGFTLNLGNYESGRIDAGVEIQGYKDEISSLWEQAEKEVGEQLDKQVQLMRKELENKHGTLLKPGR